MGGENTYTQTLLANPPNGVKYTYFRDALISGEIVYTKWQVILTWLIKLRLIPPDAGYQCIRMNKKFDLIHSHVYNVKLDGDNLAPVILSDSSSNYLFLRDYLGWGRARINFFYSIKRFIAKKLNIYDQTLNLKDAMLIVWSEFARKIHTSLGVDGKKIAVVYPGILKRKLMNKKRARRLNILFIGLWFERKGGMVLLNAYEILKKRYPDIHLTLLGPLPKNVKINRLDITQIDFVSYDKLLNEYYPKADIFVLVPPKAEGFGMVSVEAASFSIPLVASDVYALPEIVKDGVTGLVIKPRNVNALAAALDKLIRNKKLREQMGANGRARFSRKFTTEAMNKQLLRIYRESV